MPSGRFTGGLNRPSMSLLDPIAAAAADDPDVPPPARYGWVVLDGPVDPLWVEMLNPVLDDNRTLCLNTGETIPLREGVNIIMEVRGRGYRYVIEKERNTQ